MLLSAPWTAEDLLLHRSDDERRELDEGELVAMAPVFRRHAQLAARLAQWLGSFVHERQLGEIQVEMGFVLSRSPDVLRAPDVSFVRAERLRGGDPFRFFEGAPDLAIEILSPSEPAAQLARKVRQYLQAGTPTVWVVDPASQQVYVYRASGEDRLLRGSDFLTAPDLLPGFSLSLSDLFAE